jgi:altronate hydrolase
VPICIVAELRVQGAYRGRDAGSGSRGRPPRRVFKNVDGVKFLEHGLGCGGTRQDAQALCRLLAGYINSPTSPVPPCSASAASTPRSACLENELATLYPQFDKPAAHLRAAEEQIRARHDGQRHPRHLPRPRHRRMSRRVSPAPLSNLIMAVECGGSDGFSGISANPAIGHTADILAALGGAPVLSEFPELCGVEQSLSDRCVSAALADKFVGLMRAYEGAAQACGSGFDANPSPGNIRDGLITDGIKSAGAAKKAAPVPSSMSSTTPNPSASTAASHSTARPATT